MMNRMRSIFKRLKPGEQSQRQGVHSSNVHSTLNSLPLGSTYNRRTTDKNEEDITIILLTRHEENIKEHELVQSLCSISNFIQVCRSESETSTILESVINEKVFLIADGISDTLLADLAPLKQIDSLFLFAPNPPDEIPTRVTAYCCDQASLIAEVKQAQVQLEKQIAAFSVYDQAEKSTRDLSREAGSFLFFQLFKTVILRMPKSAQAKRLMISKCRDYYRGNTNELNNIDDFEQNYKASEAILWYTKDAFVYRLINKALRTEDVEALYHFRFYIVDLCTELEKNFIELKRRQPDNVLCLYRGFKAAPEEIESFQRNVGNLISVNGYLSTSRDRKVAFDFATKPTKRPNIQRALFEYRVDLTLVKKVIIADIAEYSKFPDEAEVLFDLGASFQIESCTYNIEENLWLIHASATDKGADVASEYIQYQKAKVADSNIVLMFGHLLIETGECVKAEKYFDAILRSSNPNDEEIACIHHNIGRAYRLKAEYERALVYLNSSYEAHLEARPPRLISAARTINTIGVVYMEQGHFDRAEESFRYALKLYSKTVHRNHADIGGTLINLADLHCQQGRFDEALFYFTRALKIYERSLPPEHPNIALATNNLGILHYRKSEYDLALDAFTRALTMKEKVLPADHPDLVRTVHNLAVVHARSGHFDQAELYFERAAECALPETHPFMHMLKNNRIKCQMALELGLSTENIDISEIDRCPIIHF